MPTFEGPEEDGDEMIVCGLCGSEIVRNKAGILVHIEEIPKGIEDHDAEAPMARAVWENLVRTRTDLKAAATDLMVHHAQTCPASSCLFIQRLSQALKA